MNDNPSPRSIAAVIAEAINTEYRAAVLDGDPRPVNTILTVSVAIADSLHRARILTDDDLQWLDIACTAMHFGDRYLAGQLAAGCYSVTVTMTAGDTAYAPGTTKKVLHATGNGHIVYTSPWRDGCWQSDTSDFIGHLLPVEPGKMRRLEDPAAFRAHRRPAEDQVPK